MKADSSYEIRPLSFLRKAVIASASTTRMKNTIHSITEIDISEPRKKIKEYNESKGVKLSFTGYIVSCLAKIIKKYPEFNSFISGNKKVILKDIIINVLVEREIGGESVPEPLPIKRCSEKTLIDITDEIRLVQKKAENGFGSLSNSKWFTLIPSWLLKTFVNVADKNIKMGVEYGKIAVTSAGMFSKEPVWFVPHGSSTVTVTIGSIINRILKIKEEYIEHEHLCITVSFDHDLIDGAPASRFMNDFILEIKSGNEIERISG